LDALHDWWLDEHKSNVIALVGIGGAGKTAIVHEFSAQLDDENHSEACRPTDLPRPAALFVWSFYEAPCVEDFLTELLSYLTCREFEPASRRATVFQVLEVFEQFSGNRILIVLDGLERMQEEQSDGATLLGALHDSSLKQLTRRITDGIPGIRLLVTSRISLSDLTNWRGKGYEVIEVDQLPPSSAISLLRANGVGGNDSQLDELSAEFGYHALSLELLGNLLREFYDGDPDSVRRLRPRFVENLEDSIRVDVRANRLVRLFRFYEEKLTPVETLVLQCLSIFRIPVNAETFADIFQGWIEEHMPKIAYSLAHQRLEQHLHRLSALYLVYITRDLTGNRRLTLHPAVRQYFRSRIHDAEALHEIARNSLAALCITEARRINPCRLDLFEEFLYHTAEAGRIEEAFTSFYEYAGYYYLGWRLGVYSRGESISRTLASFMETAFPPYESVKEYQAKLINQRGKFLLSLGNLQLSTQCFEYNVLAQKHIHNNLMTCRGLQNVCIAYILRGQLTEALVAAEEACLLAEELDAIAERWDAFACRGIARSLRGDILTALDDFAQANVADALHRIEQDVLHGQKMVNYGKLLVRLGKLDSAEKTLRQVRSLYEKSDWPSDARRCDLVLACIARSQGNKDEALLFTNRAMAGGVETADQEVLVWGYLMRTYLAVDTGDLADAIRASCSGLQIAEQCGYGVYWIDLKIAQGQACLNLGDSSSARECAQLALHGARQPDGLPYLCGASSSESQYSWGEGDAFHLLGQSLLASGDASKAKIAFSRSLGIRQRISDPKAVLSEQQLRSLGAL